MTKMVKTHMKVHSFDPSDSLLIIAFIAAFKLACNMDSIPERIAMWIPLFFVQNALASTLNSRMSAATNVPPALASVRTAGQLR